ncbi:MAG TPA: YfiR family protein [Candidatus Acidoferrum sp.]|nr:YfiR family protein [Candidatus Acidoferrum sp.]
MAALLLSYDGSGQTPATPYQLKAAFLFHFAEFVEWPPQTFTDPSSPLVIGILGESSVREDLERTLRGKTVRNHPLEVKEIRTPVDAAHTCHVLFITAAERKRVAEFLAGLRGASVLTVSETERFTENGGMINFVSEGTKIRFQINDQAAKDAGLKVSSKLLSLASRPAH